MTLTVKSINLFRNIFLYTKNELWKSRIFVKFVFRSAVDLPQTSSETLNCRFVASGTAVAGVCNRGFAAIVANKTITFS